MTKATVLVQRSVRHKPEFLIFVDPPCIPYLLVCGHGEGSALNVRVLPLPRHASHCRSAVDRQTSSSHWMIQAVYVLLKPRSHVVSNLVTLQTNAYKYLVS
jgi:hypothetical protein